VNIVTQRYCITSDQGLRSIPSNATEEEVIGFLLKLTHFSNMQFICISIHQRIFVVAKEQDSDDEQIDKV